MKIPLTKWRADKLAIEYSMLIVSHSAQSVTFNIFFNPKGEYKTIVCITICTVLLHIMGLYPPRISLQSSTLMIVTPFKNVFPNLNITYWKVTISNEDFSGIETKAIESDIFPGSLYIRLVQNIWRSRNVSCSKLIWRIRLKFSSNQFALFSISGCNKNIQNIRSVMFFQRNYSSINISWVKKKKICSI